MLLFPGQLPRALSIQTILILFGLKYVDSADVGQFGAAGI